MCELLEVNNQTGYGYCLIICKKFVFLAPLKEPYIYTKGEEIKENKETKEENKENKENKEENKENKENINNNEEKKENEDNKKNEENVEKVEQKEKEEVKKICQRIPIFIEPYYFLGIYTLPYIESEWPESIERKNVKFDLIEILKKSTN